MIITEKHCIKWFNFLPAELETGAVKMSLFGYDANAAETVRATTIIKMLSIKQSGFDCENGSPIPSTTNFYQYRKLKNNNFKSLS